MVRRHPVHRTFEKPEVQGTQRRGPHRRPVNCDFYNLVTQVRQIDRFPIVEHPIRIIGIEEALDIEERLRAAPVGYRPSDFPQRPDHLLASLNRAAVAAEHHDHRRPPVFLRNKRLVGSAP
jgi:hypothetical protein